MTELTFLIDLLLNHKLPKATRDAVAERIKEVETQIPTGYAQPRIVPAPATVSNQAPSMQAIMARHPDLVPQPVEVIAQTPKAVEAMASRNQAIAESMAGKVDKTTGRPKKW